MLKKMRAFQSWCLSINPDGSTSWANLDNEFAYSRG
jgi:hypothetical protein